VRVFRQLIVEVDGVEQELHHDPLAWTTAGKMLSLLLPSFTDPHRYEMDYGEWEESMPTNRRVPLRQAKVLLDEGGWRPKYGYINAHLKVECGPMFSKDKHGIREADFSAARLIQAPHDVAHVIAGPKIKPCLKMLKQDWNYQAPIFYASTKPVELLKWLQYGVAMAESNDLTVFWSDFTMYDCSFRDVHWDFVESLYGSLRKDPLFSKVLKAWRRPRGTCGDFRYQSGVMNASGRDDTAFGNGVLNGFASFLSAAAAWYGIEIRALTVKLCTSFANICKLAVCGDDSLGFLPGLPIEKRLAFIVAFRKNLAKFGFKAKAFASNRLVDGVFLAHRPVQTRKGWFWGKTIGRAFYKLGTQSTLVGDPLAWLTGVTDMHAICSKHVPILFDACHAWSSSRAKHKRTPIVIDPYRPWEWPNHGLEVPNYDDLTIDCICKAYSVHKDICTGNLEPTDVTIVPDDIKSCIAYVNDMLGRAAPCVLDHWVLRHMIWVDEL
jgi:hypothetical protein